MNDDRNESGLPAGRACENWRGPLTRYMDDEMSDEKRTAVERHLELCKACRREVERRNAARAQWSGVLSLDSTPEDRSAIMDAAREYAVFLGMWSEADEGVPQVDDARQRLAVLESVN